MNRTNPTRPDTFAGLVVAPVEGLDDIPMTTQKSKIAAKCVAKSKAKQAITAATKPTLVESVRNKLFEWETWAMATERGVITPVQFLAVILYVLSDEGMPAKDEASIVNEWGRALLTACDRKIVVALNPVTLLASTKEDGDNWVLSIAHADYFLENTPIGFSCRDVLAYWRDQVNAKGSAEDVEITFDQAKAQRLATGAKSTKWTDSQKKAVQKEISARTGKAIWSTVAKELKLAEQTLRAALKKRPEKPVAQPAVRGNVHPLDSWMKSSNSK